MKKLIIVFIATAYYITITASEPNTKKNKLGSEDFIITKEIPATSVKNQFASNTCWSFATLSFMESELLRTSNKVYDLSEMFIVRNVYMQKANKYIRMHGTINFAGGGEPNDVLNVIKSQGILPEEAYSGLLVDTARHNHSKMDMDLKMYVDSIINNLNPNTAENWQEGFTKILDSYMGEQSQKFSYQGVTFTSASLSDTLGWNPDDYIMLTSFTHHPFYEPFAIEVPDNWSWGKAYNIPIDTFKNIADSAIENGYSLVWATDYSEKGFMYSKGMAVAPSCIYSLDTKPKEDSIRKMSVEEYSSLFSNMNNPIEEILVTQELRQKAFDNYSTTDDHGMHIVGKAKDKNGKDYYYVKNSWGSNNLYGGHLFVSEAYFQYKTISIMLNKNALPQSLKEKLKISN